MDLTQEQKEQIKTNLINNIKFMYGLMGFNFISDTVLRISKDSNEFMAIEYLSEFKTIVKDEDKPNYNALLKTLLEKIYNNFKIEY